MIAYPGDVFDKLEPAVTRTAALPAYSPCEVSIAISLKRIADALDKMTNGSGYEGWAVQDIPGIIKEQINR